VPALSCFILFLVPLSLSRLWSQPFPPRPGSNIAFHLVSSENVLLNDRNWPITSAGVLNNLLYNDTFDDLLVKSRQVPSKLVPPYLQEDLQHAAHELNISYLCSLIWRGMDLNIDLRHLLVTVDVFPHIPHITAACAADYVLQRNISLGFLFEALVSLTDAYLVHFGRQFGTMLNIVHGATWHIIVHSNFSSPLMMCSQLNKMCGARKFPSWVRYACAHGFGHAMMRISMLRHMPRHQPYSVTTDFNQLAVSMPLTSATKACKMALSLCTHIPQWPDAPAKLPCHQGMMHQVGLSFGGLVRFNESCFAVRQERLLPWNSASAERVDALAHNLNIVRSSLNVPKSFIDGSMAFVREHCEFRCNVTVPRGSCIDTCFGFAQADIATAAYERERMRHGGIFAMA